jgi:aminoglycoside phosphotransferase (APT) family kinase protein
VRAQIGEIVERLVVRMAPAEGTFADYDLSVQGAAQLAAAAAGVPTATPLTTETDPVWLGAPFSVMPRVDGHIIGEAPPFDPWLTSLAPAEQSALHDNFLATLALTHTGVVERVPVRDDDAELAYWDAYLEWSSGGVPLRPLVDALAWCRAHTPRAYGDHVLRWGDVRLGNVIFGDDLKPRAVLDWDMAAIGRPEHDVAWFTMLDDVMTRMTGRRVEGFPERAATIACYERHASRTLHDLEWYETFALLRSTAVLTRIGYLTRADGRRPPMPIDDNPLLDYLRARCT